MEQGEKPISSETGSGCSEKLLAAGAVVETASRDGNDEHKKTSSLHSPVCSAAVSYAAAAAGAVDATAIAGGGRAAPSAEGGDVEGYAANIDIIRTSAEATEEAGAAAIVGGAIVAAPAESLSALPSASTATEAGLDSTASTTLPYTSSTSGVPSEQQQVASTAADRSNAQGSHGREEGGVGVVGVEVVRSMKPPPAKAASTSRTDDFREALVGFYSVHNPGRLNDLDSILERYAGKEELLVERLESKYSIDLSYARRAAAASVSLGRVGAPRVASVGDLSSLPLRPSPQEHHHRHHQQQQQQRQQSHQTRLHSSTSAAAAAAAAATPGLVHGAPTKYSSGAVGAGASPSSSYMTYLADQIRSNVGGFLPASNNPSGGGIGGGGGGGGVYPGPFAPPSAPIAGGEKQLTAGFDGGAAARGPGGAGLGATMNAGSKNMSRSISSSSSSNRHQYVGGGSDPVLTARVRALEEERGGLLAACRRMQGKADAAAREVAATEELHEAGQRKIAGFAERTAAAERQTREVAARLRALESGQAALKGQNEASARRCATKHAQLLSAIDLQMSLRSQLEALLEVVPPSPLSASSSFKALGLQRLQRDGGVGGGGGDGGVGTETSGIVSLSRRPGAFSEKGEEAIVSASSRTPGRTLTEDGDEAPGARRGTGASGEADFSRENAGGGGGGVDGEGGGTQGGGRHTDGEGKVGGGGLGEVKRLCSVLEVLLRASRREALEARRARDVAEHTARQQREDLMRLQKRVVDLEASLAREQKARKGASQAASGLEAELELRLGDLRSAEADLSDQVEANSRLEEGLRGASARLATASAARSALVSFCRQERTAVERLAVEQVVRAEESAGMLGEEGLARGLELARLAGEVADKRAAGLGLEVDRLGKALFASRARLAGSEARAQGLRRELERAAETIVKLRGSRDVDAIGADEGSARRGGGGGGARAGGLVSPGGWGGGGETAEAAAPLPAAAVEPAAAAALERKGGARGGTKTTVERSGDVTEEALLIRNRTESAATATGVGKTREEGAGSAARGSSTVEGTAVSGTVGASWDRAADSVNAIAGFNVE